MPLEAKRVYQDAPDQPEPRTFTRDEAHARPGVYKCTEVETFLEARIIVLNGDGLGLYIRKNGDVEELSLGFHGWRYTECQEPVTVTWRNVPEE